jgi:hypothetical protein
MDFRLISYSRKGLPANHLSRNGLPDDQLFKEWTSGCPAIHVMDFRLITYKEMDFRLISYSRNGLPANHLSRNGLPDDQLFKEWTSG